MEVATLGGRTSRGSVGVTGLIEVMVSTDARGITGVTVVIGVRGSGLTMVHKEEEAPPPLSISVSFSMASELRMTRKWVFSDGVMVTVFSSSGFSFLVTWSLNISGGKKLLRGEYTENYVLPLNVSEEVLTLVVSGNSPQVHCMWDSALSKLSEGLTISSESLFGEKA